MWRDSLWGRTVNVKYLKGKKRVKGSPNVAHMSAYPQHSSLEEHMSRGLPPKAQTAR